MIAEVYDALLSAGADDGKARRAAEVLTNFDDKFANVDRRFDQIERRIDGVERRIDQLEGTINTRFAAVDGRFAALEAKFDGKFNLLYWMFGLMLAGISALVIRTFF